MNKTLIKDILRNIIRQKVSFISIAVIALLGVAIFLGLEYSAAGIRKNGSDYFKQQQVRDIELVSTLLFTDRDLEDMRAVEGVSDVEAVWQVSAKASSGGDRRDVGVVSLSERINLPRLTEGRLPENESECAAERKLAEEMGWTLGSEILLCDPAGERVQYLKGERFILTGIADHPDHNNTMIAETSYVLVTPAAFDAEALDGCCMKAEIAIDQAPDADRFSEAYLADVRAVSERLEELALTGAARRDADAHEQFQSQIDEKQRELDSAKDELRDARKELDEGWSALEDGERELEDAQEQLERARKELEDGWKQLEQSLQQLTQGKAVLDAAKAQLDAGSEELRRSKSQLDNAKAVLTDGWNSLETAKAQIRGAIRSSIETYCGDSSGFIQWGERAPANVDSPSANASQLCIASGLTLDLSMSLDSAIMSFVYSDSISDELLLRVYVQRTGSEEGFDAAASRAELAANAVAAGAAVEADYHALHDSCNQWNAGHAQYLSGLTKYNAGLAQYNGSLAAYEDGMRQYEAGLAAYQLGLKRYQEGKAEYEQGLLDAEEGKKKLEESRKKLEDGEKAYEDALPQIADGEQKLGTAREQLASLQPCRWLLFDMNGNTGYAQLTIGSDNMIKLESSFATLFVLVGALVIFATVSKMVDEQRTLIGTTKALGFFNREIFAKYISFGVSAALLGAGLGIAAARFGLEGFVLRGYNSFYSFELSKRVSSGLPTLFVILAAALLAVAAVWAACSRLLRTPAIRLMQPRVPVGAKKSATGKNAARSLYSRLVLLNMRSDLKRVLVTIVSVAGCCALVVISVTLKTAISGSLDRQYKRIVQYDWRVDFSPSGSDSAEEEIGALLRDAGADFTPLHSADITYSFGSIQLAELYCGETDEIERLYRLDDWKTGEAIPGTDEGVLIQKRMAECYGLSPGSEFEISLNGSRTAKVRVAGIFDHYFGYPVFMSPAYYEKLFGESCRPNCFFVRLNGADAAELEEQLRSVRGYERITPSDAGRETFDASTSVIDSLVVLFIFMAAVMAGVVLMNLTNIYVMQKKRELTIMRINGFTVREVVEYMLRETVLTTALGILLGLGIGSWIAYQICRTLEQPFLQIVRDPSMPAWIAGAVLTVFFAAAVDAIALRPVKHLKLTDVA